MQLDTSLREDLLLGSSLYNECLNKLLNTAHNRQLVREMLTKHICVQPEDASSSFLLLLKSNLFLYSNELEKLVDLLQVTKNFEYL